MSLLSRNPFVDISSQPVTEEDLRQLRNSLLRYWEDTSLVTKPSGERVIEVGNLRAVVETALKLMREDSDV